MFRCDSCRRDFPGDGSTTLTGRVLCSACYERLSDLVASVLASDGGQMGPPDEVVARMGWLARVRAARAALSERRASRQRD